MLLHIPLQTTHAKDHKTCTQKHKLQGHLVPAGKLWVQISAPFTGSKARVDIVKFSVFGQQRGRTIHPACRGNMRRHQRSAECCGPSGRNGHSRIPMLATSCGPSGWGVLLPGGGKVLSQNQRSLTSPGLLSPSLPFYKDSRNIRMANVVKKTNYTKNWWGCREKTRYWWEREITYPL